MRVHDRSQSEVVDAIVSALVAARRHLRIDLGLVSVAKRVQTTVRGPLYLYLVAPDAVARVASCATAAGD